MIKSIVINIIATGKYEIYADPLIESIEKFFMPGHDIKIILYTDSRKFIENLRNNLSVIQIENEPWPNPTLKRFHYFLLGEKIIENSDFTFYIDVDSLFVNHVDLPLSEMDGIIPTLHPGFYGKVGTPERNPRSKAYLPVDSDNLYFCGGFFGGDSKSFIEMSKEIKKNIDEDLSAGIIAKWHDESHLNHYLFYNPPKHILGNNFAIPENQISEFPNSPIVFLDKNHQAMRSL
jgi:hypothetical protein